MICPNCKSEFIEGVFTCPDCEVALVDHLPVPEQENKHQYKDATYVSIYNPINSQEVAIIKMILEREGIPHHIKNDRLHGAVLFSLQGPGKMELLVPEEFAEGTINLLRDELEHE